MPSVDAADVLVAAIGGVVHFTWLLAANRRGFARVLTVLASWLWVWLPTGATLPKLPLSPSASAASGWPVVLMCWVGTELCLDARGLLRRRVKSAAAESDPRLVVDPHDLCFSRRQVQEAYERWLALTPLMRARDALAVAACVISHIKAALVPECKAVPYQLVIGLRTLLVLAGVLCRGRVSYVSRSLILLAANSFSWAGHIAFLAVGDRCLAGFGRGMFANGSIATACAMSCLILGLHWLMFPVSRPHEEVKALSSWAICAATGYRLHMLHRDNALLPEEDEHGHTLSALLQYTLAATLACFYLGAHYTARHMCHFLYLIRSLPGAVEEMLA
eukprot:jgi/Tetstr1/437997/TSEL_026625.t1